MQILLNIGIVFLTFFVMEFVAWFVHKYIMHGLLWALHHDHHNPTAHHFEKNDLFFLIFAIPSGILAYTGLQVSPDDFRIWIGVGIAVYGMVYFVVHDIFIHQRFKLFKHSKHPYLIAIRKAHKIHHKYLTKEDGRCFGMLLVPFKYYEDAWNFQKKLKKAK